MNNNPWGVPSDSPEKKRIDNPFDNPEFNKSLVMSNQEIPLDDDLPERTGIPANNTDITINEITGMTFLKLDDTPEGYTGSAGKVVTVNEGQTGLIFSDVNSLVKSLWTKNGSSIFYKKGKVGVGLINPAYDFDVLGDINLTGYVYMDSAAFIQNPATRNSFIGEGVVETPGAAGVDEYFYLAYTVDNEVKKYEADGLVYKDEVGSEGSADGEFSAVYDVCSDGTHFYTIENNNDRIQKFLCSDLSFVAKLGSGGAGDGEFSNAKGICTDGTYLYVADSGNNRIQKLNNIEKE